MNNSSDSDNYDNNKIKIDPQKKRGRPRKNLFLDKPIKTSEKKEITNEEKDIILHLPVFLPKDKNKDSEVNNFTQKNSTVLSVSENEISDSESSLTNSDTDNDSDNDSDNESIESNDYKKLYKKEVEENKKKDILIKKLKDDKLKNNSSVFESEVQKDLNRHIVNMNLIDNNTNKIIENKKTDLCCWWCTYNFDSYPCFIPEKFYNDKYYVFGCFCSFNCASSYNLNMADYKVMERYALLKKLYENNCKNKLAPPKEILKKFGGFVEIEEYRKNFTICDKEYRLNLPPLVTLNHIIDEIVSEKIDTKDTSTKNNINTLKKKLPMVKNNLFNTMGIKNK